MSITETKWNDGSIKNYTCNGCGETFDTRPYLYEGPGARRKKGLDLSGKMTRSAVFAGGDMGSIKHQQLHQSNAPNTNTSSVLIHLDNEHITLKGKYFQSSGNQAVDKTVILLSGSGNTIANYLGTVIELYLSVLHVNVLAIDYRGFAQNTGTPSSRGTYVDAAAMLDYLIQDPSVGGRGAAPTTIFVHGYSLGSGPATELARNNDNLAGLILQCPFTSAGDIASEEIGWGPVGWVAKQITACGHAYDNYKKIVDVVCPVFIATANQDAMQPHGQRLATRAGNNCVYATYNGGHMDTYNLFMSQPFKTFINGHGASGWHQAW